MQLELDDYEAANLREALKAIAGLDVDRSPLWALNSGDWVLQIYFKLKEIDSHPNLTAEQYTKVANSYV